MTEFNKIDDIFAYTKPPYTLEKTSNYNDKPVLSVIIPVYNKEKFLERCLLSVENQTLGMENIELLLIDDVSTDTSKEILERFVAEDGRKNITLVSLEENTGAPSIPRNIGIDLAKGKYTMFVDADDYLATNGCKSLVDLLEESGDPYAIGKTLRIEDKKDTLIGEYNNYEKQMNVKVSEAPKVFQHLGPTARIVKTDLIRDNGIYFPHLKYSEDKLFFLRVLISAKVISKSPELVYYVNRTDENQGSLVGRTTIFEKMDTNIIALEYVLSQKYEEVIEKKLVTRLVEFDSLTRLFNRAHYLKSETKESYYESFDKIIAICETLPYSYENFITSDFNRTLYCLCVEKNYATLEKLIKWQRQEKNKKIILKDNRFYYDSGLESVSIFGISLKASLNYYFKDNDYNYISLTAFGDIDKINGLQLRNRKDLTKQINIPVSKKNGNVFEFSFLDTTEYQAGKYLVYLMYDGFEKLLIQNSIVSGVPTTDSNKFYLTVNGNLGCIIAKSEQ